MEHRLHGTEVANRRLLELRLRVWRVLLLLKLRLLVWCGDSGRQSNGR
jgi:hypothetical protein